MSGVSANMKCEPCAAVKRQVLTRQHARRGVAGVVRGRFDASQVASADEPEPAAARELLELRRANPRDDLISKLLDTKYQGERPLSQEELEDTLFLLFMAGLDTVASALGLIVQEFATNPDKRREFVALMEDPQKVGPALEELVRVHAIVPLPRRVTREHSFHGALFRQEDMVTVPTMAANRDAEEFPNPHEIQYDRSPNRHLGYGLGPHRCLGIHLARRELRIALQVLHRKLPDYHLDPDQKAVAFGGMKGLASLPLVKG